MAETTFVNDSIVANVISSTRTQFNSLWSTIATGQHNTFHAPLVSGSLDPLLAEGTSTIGNCRVACGTFRIIELSGLSSITLDTTPTVVFKTCDELWSAFITWPLVFSTMMAKGTYYSIQPDSAVQEENTSIDVVSTKGSLLMEVPISKPLVFRFPDMQLRFNLSLTFGNPEGSNAYLQSALAQQSVQFLDALRLTLSDFSKTVTKKIRQVLGPSILQNRTIPTLVIPPYTLQTCTLTGPCHPCDRCCIRATTQLCTDDCLDCACLKCSSKPRWTFWLFFVSVILLLALVIKRKIK
jgi:hypothetical protein